MKRSPESPTRTNLELIIAEQAEVIEHQAEQIKLLAYAVGQYKAILKGEENEKRN